MRIKLVFWLSCVADWTDLKLSFPKGLVCVKQKAKRQRLHLEAQLWSKARCLAPNYPTFFTNFGCKLTGFQTNNSWTHNKLVWLLIGLRQAKHQWCADDQFYMQMRCKSPAPYAISCKLFKLHANYQVVIQIVCKSPVPYANYKQLFKWDVNYFVFAHLSLEEVFCHVQREDVAHQLHVVLPQRVHLLLLLIGLKIGQPKVRKFR